MLGFSPFPDWKVSGFGGFSGPLGFRFIAGAVSGLGDDSPPEPILAAIKTLRIPILYARVQLARNRVAAEIQGAQRYHPTQYCRADCTSPRPACYCGRCGVVGSLPRHVLQKSCGGVVCVVVPFVPSMPRVVCRAKQCETMSPVIQL
jgi:hypothetical protein